ncbi:unnamed protein product, partial [marine sediment metagenome]
MGERDMFICKEDAKEYFGNKSFSAPMQKTNCDVCGKDKECYNIPYRVSMREIMKRGAETLTPQNIGVGVKIRQKQHP